jgi:translation elongation factor EF-G
VDLIGVLLIRSVANEELMDAYLESGELSVEQIKAGLRIRSLANEELMDAYLESGELSVEQIKAGLRIRSLANELIVGLCGSALKIKVFKQCLMRLLNFFLHRMKLKR